MGVARHLQSTKVSQSKTVTEKTRTDCSKRWDHVAERGQNDVTAIRRDLSLCCFQDRSAPDIMSDADMHIPCTTDVKWDTDSVVKSSRSVVVT